MGLSFVLFGLELIHEFSVDFACSVGFLMNSCALFNKDFELFFEVIELFFEIVFSLVVDDFILFDSFGGHGEDFFVPLSLLKLQLNLIKSILHGFNLVIALIFIA